MSALCRRFDISRKTGCLESTPSGHKWLNRYCEEGREGLTERSRRPNQSPNKTPDRVETAVCEVRQKHPAWGGRKIRARLQKQATDWLTRSFHSALTRFQLRRPASRS